MNIKFKKLHDAAVLPTRGSELSGGLDLYSVEDIIVKPSEAKLVNTGLAIEFPESAQQMNQDFAWVGLVCPRSGLALKSTITVLNGPGVVDNDFAGSIGVILINHGTQAFQVKQGDRIAQLVIARVAIPKPEWTDTIKSTIRGAGGFGSTGV